MTLAPVGQAVVQTKQRDKVWLTNLIDSIDHESSDNFIDDDGDCLR